MTSPLHFWQSEILLEIERIFMLLGDSRRSNFSTIFFSFGSKADLGFSLKKSSYYLIFCWFTVNYLNHINIQVSLHKKCEFIFGNCENKSTRKLISAKINLLKVLTKVQHKLHLQLQLHKYLITLLNTKLQPRCTFNTKLHPRCKVKFKWNWIRAG